MAKGFDVGEVLGSAGGQLVLLQVVQTKLSLCAGTLPPMAKGIHPKKEVRKAIKQLLKLGWTIELSEGRSAHRWGTAYCPARSSDCTIGIAGSPRVPEDQASRLLKSANRCQCQETGTAGRPQ